MRVYRSDAGWQEREKDIRADAVIVSMSPTKLSLCMVASFAEPAAVSPYKIIVPRILIGGVILDQPTGGGIGAVSVGSPCGHGGHGRSRPGSEKMLLIRHAPARGVPRAQLYPGPTTKTTSRSLRLFTKDFLVCVPTNCCGSALRLWLRPVLVVLPNLPLVRHRAFQRTVSDP